MTEGGFVWCPPVNEDTMAGVRLYYTEIRSQCVIDYLRTWTRWSDNISIRSAFTLVFSMCMWTTSRYRSHVNAKCKCSLGVHGSMNVQMSPVSTHSLSSEIHSLTITRWSDLVRNTSDFKLCFWDCLWFTAVFKLKNTRQCCRLMNLHMVYPKAYYKHHIDA